MTGKLLRLLLVAALALSMGAVAACGEDEESSSSSSQSSSEETAKKIKVGVVTDVGGLNDRGFNAAAYKGLKRAEKELGAEIRVLTSDQEADYVPNLSSLARQKYDLIVANGFLMGAATEKVANSFPTTNFGIIDFSQTAMKSKPKNVKGLTFKEAEGGYAVGYMAGLYTKDEGGDQVDLGGRRPAGSGGRRLHRGLPGRCREGESRHQGPARLFAGLRRPGEVQGDRAQPDR